MAVLFITEFKGGRKDRNGFALPVAMTPPVAEQTVAIGGSSTQSSALNSTTEVVRVHTDAICSIAFGASPTATATTMRMAAGQTEYFYVVPGSKIAVITNTYAAMFGLGLGLLGVPFAGGGGAAAPGELRHIIVMGQSNGAGVQATPVLSSATLTSGKLPKMFNAGTRPGGSGLTSFVTLEENEITDPVDGAQVDAQTVASSMARALTERTGYAYLVSNVSLSAAGDAMPTSLSAARMTAIDQGATPYNNALAQVTAGKSIAEAAGYSSYRVECVVLIHGETDQAFNITNYATLVAALQSDFNTDAKAISLQAQDIPLFACQQNSAAPSAAGTQPANGTYGGSTAYQLEQAHNGTSVFAVGPRYQYDYWSDYIHLTNQSQRWHGELYAKAIYNAVYGAGWTPLRPSSVSILSNVITVTFSVPAAPLVFDYSLVVNPGTGKGFEYFDDSGAVPTITAVALNGTDKVDITLSGAPSGYTYRHIRYGHTPVTAGAGRFRGAKGCLRDSDTSFTSAYSYPLYNHALQFVRTF